MTDNTTDERTILLNHRSRVQGQLALIEDLPDDENVTALFNPKGWARCNPTRTIFCSADDKRYAYEVRHNLHSWLHAYDRRLAELDVRQEIAR